MLKRPPVRNSAEVNAGSVRLTAIELGVEAPLATTGTARGIGAFPSPPSVSVTHVAELSVPALAPEAARSAARTPSDATKRRMATPPAPRDEKSPFQHSGGEEASADGVRPLSWGGPSPRGARRRASRRPGIADRAPRPRACRAA